MVVCLCADEGSGVWSVLGRGEKEAVSAGPRGLCVLLRRCAFALAPHERARRKRAASVTTCSASELCFSKCKCPLSML